MKFFEKALNFLVQVKLNLGTIFYFGLSILSLIRLGGPLYMTTFYFLYVPIL